MEALYQLSYSPELRRTMVAPSFGASTLPQPCHLVI